MLDISQTLVGARNKSLSCLGTPKSSDMTYINASNNIRGALIMVANIIYDSMWATFI